MTALTLRFFILFWVLIPQVLAHDGLKQLEAWYLFPEMQFYFLAAHEKAPERVDLEFIDGSLVTFAKSRLIELSPVFNMLLEDIMNIDNERIKLLMNRHAFILINYCHYTKTHLLQSDLSRILSTLSEKGRYEIAEMVNRYDSAITLKALADIGIFPGDEIEFQLNDVHKASLRGYFTSDDADYHGNLLGYLTQCDDEQRAVLGLKIEQRKLQNLIPISITSKDKNTLIHKEVANKIGSYLRGVLYYQIPQGKTQGFHDVHFESQILTPVSERLHANKKELRKQLQKSIERIIGYVYPDCSVIISKDKLLLYVLMGKEQKKRRKNFFKF